MQHVSLYAILQGHASRQPEVEAFVIEDVAITYGELCERVAAFATWLLDQGLDPGEVTGVCITDEIRHLVCAMALLSLGAPQMSLGSHESGATKRALARKTGVTQLIVEQAEDWMDGLKTIVAPRRYPTTCNTTPDIFPARATD